MKKFHLGQRVHAIAAVDYRPHAVIRVGETGQVSDCAVVFGEDSIEVLWDETHRGLAFWGNTTLLLMPELLCVMPVVDGQLLLTEAVGGIAAVTALELSD